MAIRPRKNTLKRQPTVMVSGNAQMATINTTAATLLNCEFVAITVSPKGRVALVPLPTPLNTKKVVIIAGGPASGCSYRLALKSASLLPSTKYICVWDDVAGELVITPGGGVAHAGARLDSLTTEVAPV